MITLPPVIHIPDRSPPTHQNRTSTAQVRLRSSPNDWSVSRKGHTLQTAQYSRGSPTGLYSLSFTSEKSSREVLYPLKDEDKALVTRMSQEVNENMFKEDCDHDRDRCS